MWLCSCSTSIIEEREISAHLNILTIPDVFQINTDGTLTKLFEADGPLHSPGNLALAPSNFGPFSNAVLVGNNIKVARSTPSIQATENFSGTSPMHPVARSRSTNCGHWRSANDPVPTAP
jgi:hypothetical protein